MDDDGDGIGNLCDNCPKNSNRRQVRLSSLPIEIGGYHLSIMRHIYPITSLDFSQVVQEMATVMVSAAIKKIKEDKIVL